MPKIICAGLIAADLVFEVAEMPVKGTKTRALSSHMITGGGALNAALAISGLGGEVSLCGAIGDDQFGQFLRQKMIDAGIDDRYVTTVRSAPTPRSAIMITPDGDRTIINHRDEALAPLSPDLPVSPTLLRGFPFDAALVDTRWPNTAAALAQAARRAGKHAVLDAEAPVARAQDALAAASHIVFSEQGLADFCGDVGAIALTQAEAQLGRWCAVTRGASSVLCHDGTGIIEVPAFAVKAACTLGAGDVWHGAFTLALAQGQKEENAAQWANAAASIKVSRPLHIDSLPTSDEVERLLAERGSKIE